MKKSKTFKSKCGKYDILVDEEDYQRVMDFAPNGWEIKFTTGSNNPYVITRKTINKQRKQFYLHRVVMNVENVSTPHVDHKSINPLDNRKTNLRLVTRSQNMKNRTSKKNSHSKYLGITYCKYKKTNKYRVQLGSKEHSKSKIHMGYYCDEDSAGYAYNLAAEVIHGEYANLNNVDMKLVNQPEDIQKYVEEKLKKIMII